MVNKLKELRNSGSEEGFTLIELMIVVVIIGILAAIAIPIFMNQQKGAIAAGVKSDVKNTNINVATALVKVPTATAVVGKKTGTTVATAGSVSNGATNTAPFEMVVSDTNTTVIVAGTWNTYTVYGSNTSLTGDAAAPTTTPAATALKDGDAHFDVASGKTTTK